MDKLAQARRAEEEAFRAYQDAHCAYQQDPEFIEAQKQFYAISERIQANYNDKVVEAFEKYQNARSLVSRLKEAKRIEQNNTVKSAPQSVRDFVEQSMRGTDWGPKGLLIHWHSEDGRFAIIKRSGHSYFSGRGCQSYAATTYYLVDTTIKNEHHGSLFFHNAVIAEDKGRFTEEKMQGCMHIISEVLKQEKKK